MQIRYYVLVEKSFPNYFGFFVEWQIARDRKGIVSSAIQVLSSVRRQAPQFANTSALIRQLSRSAISLCKTRNHARTEDAQTFGGPMQGDKIH